MVRTRWFVVKSALVLLSWDVTRLGGTRARVGWDDGGTLEWDAEGGEGRMGRGKYRTIVSVIRCLEPKGCGHGLTGTRCTMEREGLGRMTNWEVM
ncbi:unnamed protein product [Arabis nemorensis]|uniref:Secreted protein n=1 Tax=Arabis nemorensis TaxID=586526 RepID=A0A565BSY4_9BRAS|nr:unnamed protein product [Arabis nemorensis]